MRHVWLASVALLLLVVAPKVEAACLNGCPAVVAPCGTTTRFCDCTGLRSLPPGEGPQPAAICFCSMDTYTPDAAGTACTDDGNPCTADVCDGNGTCTHSVSGGKACNGACIAQGTCCTNADCAGIPNGTGVCAAPGSACTAQCNGGYKACGGTCIPTAACCTDGDCPGHTANHQHGVCGASACVLACDGGYKACGTTCIASAACCSSSECVSPPSSCYKPQGACTAGSCTYPYNDGAGCNADSNACTPNDTCLSGSCVTDTIHSVKCVQRDCHGVPTCNKVSGDCVDALVPDGTVCGGNGCTAVAGICSTGTCSSSPKDCSALDSDCIVGTCNAQAAVGTPCASSNQTNGTACAVGDKCVVAPACSGGKCTGTRTTCTPSGACRIAECNPGSGTCEETVAPQGTTCSLEGACTQNATCDGNGNCNGDPVPDGTPCTRSGCENAVATCGGGQCTCLASPDFGTPGIDGHAGTASGKHGCELTTHDTSAGAPWLLLVGLLVVLRRRRVAQ